MPSGVFIEGLWFFHLSRHVTLNEVDSPSFQFPPLMAAIDLDLDAVKC